MHTEQKEREEGGRRTEEGGGRREGEGRMEGGGRMEEGGGGRKRWKIKQAECALVVIATHTVWINSCCNLQQNYGIAAGKG